MSRQAKTQQRLDAARAILADFHPMTLRQVFYQLVSRQVIENTKSRYQGLSRLLADARREGIIPWEWIEDRLRIPRGGGDGWETAAAYLDAQLNYLVSGYLPAVWPTQPRYVEVWLEKDALSGIFLDVLAPYHVALNVGRGYDGWSSIHNAAERFAAVPQDQITILYFGDFDPSGDDMARSLRARLAELGTGDKQITIPKIALTPADIARYNLPPNVTKTSDSRREKFVAQHGDVSVELDALPPAELQRRLTAEVRAAMDMEALAIVYQAEAEQRDWLREEVAQLRGRL